jgi:hypothetical protein
MNYHGNILRFVYMTHKLFIHAYFIQVRTIQVNCGDSSKQLSVSTDDSATSIWRLRQNKLTLNNPVSAQISHSVSDSPSQDGNYQEECEESSEEGVSVASGSHHFAG